MKYFVVYSRCSTILLTFSNSISQREIFRGLQLVFCYWSMLLDLLKQLVVILPVKKSLSWNLKFGNSVRKVPTLNLRASGCQFLILAHWFH